MNTTATVFHQATIPADVLHQALTTDAANKPYNWRTTYPILARLDQKLMQRSATIFPDDCPNTALTCYLLAQVNQPLDSGTAVILAAQKGILAAIHDINNHQTAFWLRLSLVHWQTSRDRVHLLPLHDISVSESKQLLDSITLWLKEFNWHIHVTATNEWFVRSTQTFDYQAPSLNVAAKDQLEHALPSGIDLKRWQTLLTEIQMTWFNHPVNQKREQSGQLPINSLWLDELSCANDWTTQSFDLWHQQTNNIHSFSQTDIHAHLAELNFSCATVLQRVEQHNMTTLTFLGDTWQQDLVIQQPSGFARLKNSLRPSKKTALNWLETPHFDFLES